VTSERDVSNDDLVRLAVKKELRKRLRGLRNTMPLEACARRSAALVERLASHEAVRSARSVALFWPMANKHEVDLRDLDASLRARGVRVAYPTIDPATFAMTFRFVDDLTSMQERDFGFLEPLESAPEVDALDVVVVPALAVDPAGHRIGYGAGYYDRTLPRFVPPAVSIAVAFDWQLVAEVPAMSNDVECTFVETDTRTVK
jgi:5-formyltetrahydrofolate cyclo-ligase